MVKKIYFKIREQLEDSSHPIIWIIAKFREAFKRDILLQLEAIKQEIRDRSES